MTEYTADAVQTVNPGEAVVFTTTVFPCTRGYVRNRPGTGNFLLSGQTPVTRNQNGCCCCRSDSAKYFIDCGANIAIPTGGTVGPISLALTIDGATIPASTMIVTPAAVEQYANVSRAIAIPVWRGCCQTVTLRNTSTQAILVQNANIVFTRPDLQVSY